MLQHSVIMSFSSRLEILFYECHFLGESFLRPGHVVDVDREVDVIEAGAKRHRQILQASGAMSDAQWGCYQYLNAIYLRETWIGECGSPTLEDTEEVAIRVVEGSTDPIDGLSEVDFRKISNLQRAMKLTLGLGSKEELDACVSGCALSVDLIYKVHEDIGDGLFSDAGRLRTVDVAPAGMSVVYCPVGRIQARLATRLSFVQSHMKNCEDLRHALRVSAIFFAEFLFIHPFRNGNGRTARILVNIMLRPFTVVPFSLYLRGLDELLQVLIEAQHYGNPSPLATYLLPVQHA